MGFYNNKKNKDIHLNSLVKVKEVMNSILENGAYSDKNYERQMTKKFKNYNENEKLLVTLSYRFKKFEGEQLQKQLFKYITENKDFIEYLKINDINLYNQISELIKNAG